MSKVKFEKNKIMCFPNKDKSFQESWTPGRNLLDIPWSFRAIFCGPPSSGKSTIVKNIILQANPMYDEVLIVHFGQGGSDDEQPGKHGRAYHGSHASGTDVESQQKDSGKKQG